MGFTVAKFLDVADGVQEGQFMVGSRSEVSSPDDLDRSTSNCWTSRSWRSWPRGRRGRTNLTPVWFGHSSDKVLLNFAAHRKKTGWVRPIDSSRLMLLNPANPYHWVSLKVTVEREMKEDDPEDGHLATETIDAAWTR